MRQVWIVLKNGKVDEVFDSEAAALAHRDNLTRKWSLTEVVRAEVKSL